MLFAPTSRKLLRQWLLENTTGERLQAGVPADWTVGDKTGTNKTDANDIGILLPPQGAPVFVTAYLSDSPATSPIKEETLAKVGDLPLPVCVEVRSSDDQSLASASGS